MTLLPPSSADVINGSPLPDQAGEPKPDFFIHRSQAIRVTAWTTETDKIRMAEIMRRDVSAYVESGGGRRKPLTENSTLLRNVRKVFSRRSSARSSVLAAAR